MLKGGRAWRKYQEWLAQEAQRQKSVEEMAELALNQARQDPASRGLNGLREMLVNKSGLEKHLQQMQKKPVVVSVDRIEDRWIYVVRGMRPPISYWGDHEIWFVRGGSSHVWSPTRKLGMG